MTADARAQRGEAEIGPNAVLQTVRVIEERLGAEVSAAMLAEAGLKSLPSGKTMIREAHAIALHRAIARRLPREASAIARSAGWATADYIIAHRIPRVARLVLRLLPAPLAAPLLMGAIRRHAWTFVGAGRFEPEGAWHFTIDRARAGDGPAPPDCLFDWYGAVFTRLFRELVERRAECRILSGRTDRDRPMRHYRIERGGRLDIRPDPSAGLALSDIEQPSPGSLSVN